MVNDAKYIAGGGRGELIGQRGSGKGPEAKNRGKGTKDSVWKVTGAFIHINGQRPPIMWPCKGPSEGINPIIVEIPILTGNDGQAETRDGGRRTQRGRLRCSDWRTAVKHVVMRRLVGDGQLAVGVSALVARQESSECRKQKAEVCGGKRRRLTPHRFPSFLRGERAPGDVMAPICDHDLGPSTGISCPAGGWKAKVISDE
jgi:hypothetical protein